MLISALMPTADRPAFAEAAIRNFLLQTWGPKELIILDSGVLPLHRCFADSDELIDRPEVKVFRTGKKPLGALRNEAASLSRGDVIVTWDDDDWSHHRRMDEQYDLLAASGADIVGYDSMVFHDVSADRFALYRGMPGYALGTSMMFRRSTWERRQYQRLDIGEDGNFATGRHVVTACGHKPVRMIARQHSRNSSGPRPLMFSGISSTFVELMNSKENAALRRLLKSGLG